MADFSGLYKQRLTLTTTATSPVTPEAQEGQFNHDSPAVMVVVDNNTNLHVYIPDVDQYVPPFTTGASVVLNGTQRIRAEFRTPPGQTAAAAVVGQQASLDFYDQRLPVSTGVTQAVTNIVSNSVAGSGIFVAGDVDPVLSADGAIAPALAGTRYLGFSCRETAGAPATFAVRHGTTNADPIIDFVTLNANESAREWYGPDGLEAPNGIFFDLITGAVDIAGRFKVVL